MLKWQETEFSRLEERFLKIDLSFVIGPITELNHIFIHMYVRCVNVFVDNILITHILQLL